MAPPLNSSAAYPCDDLATLDAMFAGEADGYVYVRYDNPTVTAFEQGAGIKELVRLSVGLVASEDLTAGLVQAHAAASA